MNWEEDCLLVVDGVKRDLKKKEKKKKMEKKQKKRDSTVSEKRSTKKANNGKIDSTSDQAWPRISLKTVHGQLSKKSEKMTKHI